jgi:hypothetical protein
VEQLNDIEIGTIFGTANKGAIQSLIAGNRFLLADASPLKVS